eukprot:3766033-Amphidinium_carterae.1
MGTADDFTQDFSDSAVVAQTLAVELVTVLWASQSQARMLGVVSVTIPSVQQSCVRGSLLQYHRDCSHV